MATPNPQREGAPVPHLLIHRRTSDGDEVDLVVEQDDGSVLAIEALAQDRRQAARVAAGEGSPVVRLGRRGSWLLPQGQEDRAERVARHPRSA